MATNPYVNKVIYGNQTLMDISDTDAQEGDVVEGKTFYKGNGQRSNGTGNYYSPNDDPETDIADGDYFPFYDVSANSGNGAKRKSLWSNIKAKLKTYFDGIYLAIINIAPAFDTNTTYLINRYVNYNGNLYRFTRKHNAGAWTGNDVVQITIGEDLQDKYFSTLDGTISSSYAISDYDGLPFYVNNSSSKARITWGILKSKLKTYFDDLYATLTDRDNLLIEMSYADYQQLTQQEQEDPNKIYWCPDAPNSDDVVFPREEQRVLGAKNLLPNNAVTRTNNGITYTVNSDGSITANGTVSGDVSFLIIASGDPAGTKDNNISANTVTLFPAGTTIKTSEKRLGARCTDDTYITLQPNTEVTLAKDIGLIYISYSSGASVNNETHYPMFRLASDPDDTYVPYAMTNRELTEKHIKTLAFDVTATATQQVGSSGVYKGNATLPAFTGTFLGVVLNSVMDTTYSGGSVWASPYSSTTLCCFGPQNLGIRARGYILYI